MNQALAQYSKADSANIEEIEASIVVVRDHLDLLGRIFHAFDTSPYFSGSRAQKGSNPDTLRVLPPRMRAGLAAQNIKLAEDLEKGNPNVDWEGVDLMELNALNWERIVQTVLKRLKI